MRGDEQEPDMRCGTSGTSGHVKFRVDEFAGDILSAHLRMIVKDGSNDGGRIYVASIALAVVTNHGASRN